jgi:hypothetical protein
MARSCVYQFRHARVQQNIGQHEQQPRSTAEPSPPTVKIWHLSTN